MSAPILIPFNFQPSNTGSVSNTGYTVPTGKYAYVTISLSGSAYRSDSAAIDSSQVLLNEASQEKVLSIWLMEGDVLTVSRTNASASAGSVITWALRSATTATVSLNSVLIASISATCNFSGVKSAPSISPAISGESHIGITYAEYDNIS